MDNNCNKNTIDKILEIFKIIFQHEGLAGIIIIVFLALFVFNSYINYKMMNKLNDIVILNEYRISIIEDKIMK